jgi:hypothetical protein
METFQTCINNAKKIWHLCIGKGEPSLSNIVKQMIEHKTSIPTLRSKKGHPLMF